MLYAMLCLWKQHAQYKTVLMTAYALMYDMRKSLTLT